MNRAKYEVVAFPKGERKVVATMWGLNPKDESHLALVAIMVATTSGAEADAMVRHTQGIAASRDEFVDLNRNGDCIATVGPDGPLSDYEH